MNDILLCGCAEMWQETLQRGLASRLCGAAHAAHLLGLEGHMLSLWWFLFDTKSKALISWQLWP